MAESRGRHLREGWAQRAGSVRRARFIEPYRRGTRIGQMTEFVNGSALLGHEEQQQKAYRSHHVRHSSGYRQYINIIRTLTGTGCFVEREDCRWFPYVHGVWRSVPR